MLNRRSFLASLLATAVLDPEKLLWVPGKKLISIPRQLWFYQGDVVTLRACAHEAAPLLVVRENVYSGDALVHCFLYGQGVDSGSLYGAGKLRRIQ